MKNYDQCGETLEFQNKTTTTIESGEVIPFAGYIGVSHVKILPGEKGTVALIGVYFLPKATGLLAQGAKLFWSATNKNVTTNPVGNFFAGIAQVDAAADATEVAVNIDVKAALHTQAAFVASITGTTVDDVKTAVNSILGNLKAAGIMAAS